MRFAPHESIDDRTIKRVGPSDSSFSGREEVAREFDGYNVKIKKTYIKPPPRRHVGPDFSPVENKTVFVIEIIMSCRPGVCVSHGLARVRTHRDGGGRACLAGGRGERSVVSGHLKDRCVDKPTTIMTIE